jgi:hypothetical protein
MSAENQNFSTEADLSYSLIQKFVTQIGSDASLRDKYCNIDHSSGCEMPDGVYAPSQACEINVSSFDRLMEVKTEIMLENRLACKSAIQSEPDKKHPKTGYPFIVVLTADQARSIYLLRSASTAEGSSAQSVAGKSSLVAELFGVSPKTIRDVWNRKTWTQVPRSFKH